MSRDASSTFAENAINLLRAATRSKAQLAKQLANRIGA
jgi:hypothetical protein